MPKGRHLSRRGKGLIALVVLLVVGGTSLGGWYFFSRGNATRPDLILHTIKKEKLQITITERGSLEPADNTYFSCKVKSKTPGGASTSIRWVIENGSLVKEGDKILELDDSALQDQRNQQQILVYQAMKEWKQAELTLTIDELTNAALVETQQDRPRSRRDQLAGVSRWSVRADQDRPGKQADHGRFGLDHVARAGRLVGSHVASGPAVRHRFSGRGRRGPPPHRRFDSAKPPQTGRSPR